MKLLVLLVIASCASLTVGSGVTIGLHPELHPIHSLYHSQNFNGQYSYGYATPMITRNEVRTTDGRTQGGYSYMDTNGIIQTVQYTSDPIHGFQVSATNLPQDLPDVAAAKAKHLALFKTIETERAAGAIQKISLPQPVQDLPEVIAARQAHLAALEAAGAGVVPQPVQDTPEVVKARAEHLAILEATRARDESLRRAISLSPIPQDISGNVVSVPAQSTVSDNSRDAIEYRPAVGVSPYSSPNDLGLYSYGYVGPLSSQVETKSADGVTRGGYSYIDANWKLQTVKYIADDVNGFRVQATNLLLDPSLQTLEEQPQTKQQVTSKESNVIPESAGQNTATVGSNRGGFRGNIGNSIQGARDNVLLYKQEVQF